jgi:iron(III) transport system ATP-binding protein
MNQGVIEQVGTPEEVFSRPSSPFVAGFLGDMNFIPAIASSASSVSVGAMKFAVPAMEGHVPGSEVSLCIRPSDIVVEPLSDRSPGSMEANVETVSFRGTFYRLSMNCEQIGQALDVEITRSAQERLGICEGSIVNIGLSPSKITAFLRNG